MTEERHTYIIPGVSREVFQNVGVKLTQENGDLSYFLHSHQYHPYNEIPCNDRCQVVRHGTVESVTHLDDAHR